MDVEMREIKVAVVTISTETTTFLGHSFGKRRTGKPQTCVDCAGERSSDQELGALVVALFKHFFFYCP